MLSDGYPRDPSSGGSFATLTGDPTDNTALAAALADSRAAGLTASTTQTQGQGPLTAAVNEISVCANANDTRTLMAATGKETILVINNGAATLQIFPASGGTIDGLALNASTTIAADATGTFVSYAANKWRALL